MDILLNLLPAFYFCLAAMVVIWLISIAFNDVSLIDRYWGIGFIFLTIFYFRRCTNLVPRNSVILALVTIWGVRLAIHVFRRQKGKGKGSHYGRSRERRHGNFWLWSLIGVFGLQGFLMAVISSPITITFVAPQPGEFTLWDCFGAVIWSIGFYFEVVGDYELAQFKKNPANRGLVLRTGLWSLTRHPNYFGESLIWWGFYFFALSVQGGWATIVSPVLMTVLLLRFFGMKAGEKELMVRKAGYSEYAKKVPAFLPLIIRRKR